MISNRPHLSYFLRTTAAIVAAVVLVFTPASPVPAEKAHAQWTVAVAADIPRLIEKQLDAIGWMAAKTVVQSMTQSIVRWINSGFEGSPAFASDLERNLDNLADTVAEDFIRGLDAVAVSNTGLSIRAPFQDQIRAALRNEFYRTTSSHGFDARNPYKDCHADRGFTVYSWMCEQQPQNNVYGRYMLARDELWATVNSSTQERLRELDWGKGFYSWRGNCGKNGKPAMQTKRDAEQAYRDAQEAEREGSMEEARELYAESKALNQELTSLSGRDSSVGCSIKTPGAVIEETLGMSVNSPLRQLELADSINEIVGALMSQMVNQVLGGGGLSGLSQPSSGGGSSYLDRSTTSLSSGFLQSVAKTKTEVTGFLAGWRKIADAASTAKQMCRNDNDKEDRADAVLSEANARAGEAGAMLTKLDEIGQTGTTLQAGGGTSNGINFLISEYQSLLTRMGPVAQGSIESRDTGKAEPSSLYSEMVQLTRSCSFL